MRDANSFAELKAKEGEVQMDKYIENNIYNQFDEGIYPAVIYLNKLDTDEINPKELMTRLKELKFIADTGRQGVDKVIKVKVK